MYIRRMMVRGRFSYWLRESVWQGDYWGFRDLLDLGHDPSDFIELPGGNGFYFKPELEQALAASGVAWTSEELDFLFLPFLPQHIQRVIEAFGGVGSPPDPRLRLDPDQLRESLELIHPFDKRRLHFLRCGRVDMGRLQGRVLKLFKVLLGKGRDEIENLLEGMEMALRPYEIRPYIYTALDLQSYFPQHLLKNQPAALDPEKVDGYVLDAVCALNRDREFFRGIPNHRDQHLHPFLIKYVTQYFDHEFHYAQFQDEILGQFMGQRQFRSAPPRAPLETTEACRLLGISRQDFERMSVRDLIRCYRNLVMKTHPDKGGDHEAFIRATSAYECLLGCKRR